MELAPQVIKDSEFIGDVTQVFFVHDCQPNGLEFALGDPNIDVWDDETATRVLVCPGDSFYVPPFNRFRMENHSEVKVAKVHYILVKAVQQYQDFPVEETSNNTVGEYDE
jgi:hypothetical protein